MNIDIKVFFRANVIDTCSVWNIISSPKLYTASLLAGCDYSMTKTVEHECLKTNQKNGKILIQRLKEEIQRKKIKVYQIEIEDLQDPELLKNRKKIGKGELASIAFAKKTNLAFLTDDKGARKQGNLVLEKGYTQTTPHLVGYLFFNRFLIDSDLNIILNDHNSSEPKSWGNLEPFFREVYEEAMKLNLHS